MKVVIIGSGNVATILGKKIRDAGHEMVQVMSRNEANASALARELNCAYTSRWDKISTEAACYLIAIPDRVLPELHRDWKLERQLVVHTAGSVSKDVLGNISRNYGVLYPLQSLHKDIVSPNEIPMLIDGNTNDDLALIQDFAATISRKVVVADDEQRMKLHLAAVMINNFSNHLYSLAAEYCQQEQVDFRALLPLAQETVRRLDFVNPTEVQTGPAIRDDRSTIQKHLDLLMKYPELQDLYQYFSSSITQYYSNHFANKE